MGMDFKASEINDFSDEISQINSISKKISETEDTFNKALKLNSIFDEITQANNISNELLQIGKAFKSFTKESYTKEPCIKKSCIEEYFDDEQRIKEVRDFNGYTAKLYYVKSTEDLESIRKHNNCKTGSFCSDFNLYGVGWYIASILYVDGFSNFLKLRNLKYYIDSIICDIEEYQKTIYSIILDKEKELEEKGFDFQRIEGEPFNDL